MSNRNDWFDDLQRNVSDLIAKSPAADLERNVKAMMTQAFARMDLITREEFDVQKALLERALLRIAALESRVQTLEGIDAGSNPAVAETPFASDSGSDSSDDAPADDAGKTSRDVDNT